MKLVLAGAFGKLGGEILKAAVAAGYQVVAADMVIRPPQGLDPASYTAKTVDVTKPETLKGLCDGADAVITTVGLTTSSAAVTNYDIDYQGNLNLLREAKAAGVAKFVYISVIKADQGQGVPMVHAKYLLEEELKQSGIPYVILRPTGYFYDIVKVFRPMIEKGSVTLLGKKPVSCNVIDTPDFAAFILAHLGDSGVTYSIGGKETWTYEEIARMCFAAAGKEPVIKHAPPFLFDVLAWVNKRKRNGKEAILRFSKWTLTKDMVGDTKAGEGSFAAYIRASFREG